MTSFNDADRLFDENLRRAGAQITLPDGPSSDLVGRCTATVEAAPARRLRRIGWSRTVVASALGIAAALAFATFTLLPSKMSAEAQAAMILAHLDEQVQAESVIDLAFRSVRLDGASVDGDLSVGDGVVAGNLKLAVQDEGEAEPIEMDLAMGFSPGSKWVLVRKLVVPDEEARAIVGFLFPPGSETLITLPNESINDPTANVIAGVSGGLRVLNSREIIEALVRVVNENASHGATVTNETDGSMLLTLPLHDAAVLQSVGDAIGDAVTRIEVGANSRVTTQEPGNNPHGFSANITFGHDVRASSGNASASNDSPGETDEAATNDDDLGEFAGSTLVIRYDPASEKVRSIAIMNIGPTQGSITINIGGGQIDASRFDANLVTTPATRRLDLNALASYFHSQNGG